jgi:hypothetical protein
MISGRDVLEVSLQARGRGTLLSLTKRQFKEVAANARAIPCGVSQHSRGWVLGCHPHVEVATPVHRSRFWRSGES